MYNRVTAEKIRNIPQIGDIDISRLPQELTRIYAHIISLRRQLNDGSIVFLERDLSSEVSLLRRLANNLETILITLPNHEQKESIAFVAATANNLIYKLQLAIEDSFSILNTNSISPYLAAVILFLIGNSQADAAETAISIENTQIESLVHQRLISSIVALATGKLVNIAGITFTEQEISSGDDLQEIAINYLWREIGLGITDIAKRLLGQPMQEYQNRFDRVIELSKSEIGLFGQRNVFAGPYRLAKLLKILEGDIFNRAVINIPSPLGIDPIRWEVFLEELAKDRPYLWENHKEVVSTSFLNPGTSAVLTFPTGTGKSTLSELKIASCLYSNKKVVYLVPTHALENQVNKNLRDLFVEFEPVLQEVDGEYTEIIDENVFPILVMTPERCLTLLNIDAEFFNTIGLVVFDEFHLIHGTDIKKDRRSVDAMYCLLSLLTLIPQSDFLLISAMVENGEEIASWVSQITKRECILFNSSWKPTRQLHGCLVFDENAINGLKEKLKQQKKLQKGGSSKIKPGVRIREQMVIAPHCFFSLKNVWETDSNLDYYQTQIFDDNVLLGISEFWQLTSNRNDTAARIAANFSKLGLKTLIFVSNPGNTISIAHKIASSLTARSNNYEGYIKHNSDAIARLEAELGDIKHSYFDKQSNVGVHHGLLLPIERTLIEGYFKYTDGSIVLVATATLAQGINLPAEIVIIAGDDRYDEADKNMAQAKPFELLNAAGRAGRAGLSAQGAVILIPGDIVTIKGTTVSSRWWQLKEEVFSKGDQCLKVEDPLKYFLDSIQETKEQLSVDQLNVLRRFKPDDISENETKRLLSNSFYAKQAAFDNNTSKFDTQVERLLKVRNELDVLDNEISWEKEIGFKVGLEPSIIYALSNAIDKEDFNEFISRSTVEFIEWFFTWLQSNDSLIGKVFPKASTRGHIKLSIGLKYDAKSTSSDIILKLPILSNILKDYVRGKSLNLLNDSIPDSKTSDKSPYLTKARNFVIRLIPDLSFSFGMLSMVLIEKAKQKGIDKKKVSWNVRVLASCIREGLDSSDKLFYKKHNQLSMRVETHQKFTGK